MSILSMREAEAIKNTAKNIAANYTDLQIASANIEPKKNLAGNHVETVSEAEAEFWGVYVKDKDGLMIWVADVDSMASAEVLLKTAQNFIITQNGYNSDLGLCYCGHQLVGKAVDICCHEAICSDECKNEYFIRHRVVIIDEILNRAKDELWHEVDQQISNNNLQAYAGEIRATIRNRIGE